MRVNMPVNTSDSTKTFSHRINRRFPFFFLAILTLLFQSCQNRESDLGLDLREDGGIFNALSAEDFSINAITVAEDSFTTDSLSAYLLGGLNDPGFGTTRSAIVTQAVLREFNFSFGIGTRIDSVVLALRYGSNTQVYGPNSIQTLRVYRLESDLERTTRYFSNSPYTKGGLIGSWTGKFAPKDSVTVIEKNKTYVDPPQLRIRLDNVFGAGIADAPSSVFTSNDAFIAFLKGLVIEADAAALGSGEGGIASFNLNSGFSRLQVYYNDSLFRSFDLGSPARKYAKYEVLNRSANVSEQLNSTGTFPLVYAQGMGSCKVKIEIPDLFAFLPEGKDVFIHEAHLSLTPDAGTVTDAFPLPERLNLFKPDPSGGANRAILDYLDFLNPNSQYPVYGGSYNASEGSYSFRFNRELQEMIKAFRRGDLEVNRGFYITVPADFPMVPSRIVLKNDATGTQRIRLKVLYTELN